MKNPGNRKGFSLTEVLVASILTAVVLLVLVVFLRIHSDAVNEGMANSKMQLQTDIVSGEIARQVRSANRVLDTSEVWSASTLFAVRNSKAIVLYDTFGNFQSAYRTGGGILREDTNGTGFHVFKVGLDSVLLDSASAFQLSPNRKAVVWNLNIVTQYRNKLYKAIPKGYQFSCRN